MRLLVWVKAAVVLEEVHRYDRPLPKQSGDHDAQQVATPVHEAKQYLGTPGAHTLWPWTLTRFASAMQVVKATYLDGPEEGALEQQLFVDRTPESLLILEVGGIVFVDVDDDS